MNDTAEIAIDVRDAVKRYGDFTALQKFLSGFVTMNSLRFWGHLVAARRRFCG